MIPVMGLREHLWELESSFRYKRALLGIREQLWV